MLWSVASSHLVLPGLALLLLSLSVNAQVLQRAQTDVDFAVRIDLGDGDAAADGHDNWIDVESWSWGESTQLREEVAFYYNKISYSGTEVPPAADLVIVTRSVDRASASLLEYCANGRHLETVELAPQIRRRENNELRRYELEDVRISSYSVMAPVEPGGQAVETIVLSFEGVTIGMLLPAVQGVRSRD